MGTDLSAERLLEAVVDSFGDTADARTRQVLQSLTKHLHAFINDVELTYDEWEFGIDFLTRTGKMCNDVRQEFILLSDVLGASMLVETLNDTHTPEATASTVLGPFHMVDSPERALGDNVSPQSAGQICVVHGRVLDGRSRPIVGATVDVWQANADGFYDVQQPDAQVTGNGRGLFTTDEQGRFWFTSVVPSFYPIPTDGPVGELLSVARRHEFRPAHIHFIAAAPGYKELTTHIFVNDSKYLDSDAVFAVKESLVRNFVGRPAGTPNPCGVTSGFVEAEIDLVLHFEGAGHRDQATTARGVS